MVAGVSKFATTSLAKLGPEIKANAFGIDDFILSDSNSTGLSDNPFVAIRSVVLGFKPAFFKLVIACAKEYEDTAIIIKSHVSIFFKSVEGIIFAASTASPKYFVLVCCF